MGRIAGVQNKLTTEAKDKLGFIESFRSTFVYSSSPPFLQLIDIQ